jgi:hypothetical protein
MPIALSKALFLSNTPRAGAGELFSTETFVVAAYARPYGEGFDAPAADYRIHRAHHAGNPGRRRLLEMKHGEHFVVAVYDKHVVGFVRRDLLWVHPDHRGNRLGPEMAAELLVAMGCEKWTYEQWSNWLSTPQFTVAGHRNRHGVYDVLVRRGIITEP